METAYIWGITASFGSGISISLILFLFYKAIKKKLEYGQLKRRFRLTQALIDVEDSKVGKWVAMTENNIKKAGIKINIITYLVICTISATAAFFGSMYLLKNLTGSLLFTACFFVLPEHAITLVNQKRQEKIQDQLIGAIRIFTAEFLQTPQIERGFEAIGNRIGNPIGGYFKRANTELVIGTDQDVVLSTLANKLDTEYGRMFVQLARLASNDSSISPLFTELLEKIENNIETNRKNYSNLVGERMLALMMTCIPIPTFFFMTKVVPETTYFLANTSLGRLIVILTFGSMLTWAILDRITGSVEG